MIISIILVTYCSEYYIEQCLSSLFFNTNKRLNKDIEVLIVDNASQDKTYKIIKNKFPYVRVYRNKKNLGFAAAANQGAKIAKGEYLLFLNPDTIVKSSCIDRMIEFVKNNEDAAVVGCRVLNSDGTLQPSCGSFPTISNIILDRIPIINTLLRTELLRQKDFYNKEQTPDWVSGAFFMTKRDIFLKLGGFDERYFMYVEDVDFCYRARRLGFNTYYNPKAEITHYDMGKSKDRRKFKAKQMRRGFSIFFEKYKSAYYLFLWRMLLAIESIFRPNLKIK